MHFIIRIFPEITIKSTSVRRLWTKQLRSNIKFLLKPITKGIEVLQDWDKLDVRLAGEDPQIALRISEQLGKIPGIISYSRVMPMALPENLEEIGLKLADSYRESIKDQRFCVRVKRNGNHSFTSTEAEHIIGGTLKAHTEAGPVDLKNPELRIEVLIKKDQVFLVQERWQGMGGFPLGTQDPVLSLVSGGFDSTVASYQMQNRGMLTHFCFFNLGGRAHELGVREIAFHLWHRYSRSHRVKFVSVPFEGVVREILERVDNRYMGVILKRMMLRAASQVAEQLGIGALVTGEAIAQVSSQTLANLKVIDAATDALVLRPLIVTSKRDIIDAARAIGTEDFAAAMPEYCAVISDRPTVKADPDKVADIEQDFDFSVLEQAINDRQETWIYNLAKDLQQTSQPIYISDILEANDQIIDIRHPDEQELKPIPLPVALASNTSTDTSNNNKESEIKTEILAIPFYSLATAMNNLDPSKRYLLYCDRGVMSQLQAANLIDQGFSNVGVYRQAFNKKIKTENRTNPETEPEKET